MSEATPKEASPVRDVRVDAIGFVNELVLRYANDLKTGVKEGKITTHIFASDTPYDRKKSPVGEVSTPMFEPQADARHLDKVERLLYAWVDFVKEDVDSGTDFKTFEMDGRHG